MPEPSVAPRACGGASVAATQPPAAFWPPEERRDIVAGQSSWEPAAGSRCEARYMASRTDGLERGRRKTWYAGEILAVDTVARTCVVLYDDGF